MSRKTLSEFLTDNPNFYDEADGYTYSTATGGYVNTGISEAEKELIENEFGDRYLFDDSKFARRFLNQINYTALRYANLSRIELTAFDPLVADYLERRQLTDKTQTRTDSSEQSKSGTFENDYTDNRTETPGVTETEQREITPGIVETEEREHTPRVEETNTKTITPGIVETVENNERRVDKSAPMSISYNGAVAGNIPNLDWGNLTSQTQGDGGSQVSRTGSDTETTVTGRTGKDNDVIEKSKTGKDNEEIVRSKNGYDTIADIKHGEGENSQHVENEGSSNLTEGKEDKVIQTGRSGLTPQEALKAAVGYLKDSNAWLWRRAELNELFKPVSYDPDNEWMYI